MKTPKRVFCLVSLTHREIAKRRGGKPILYEGRQPPRDPDYPRAFQRRNGWSFEEITETVTDPNHTGAPKYELREHQTARVTKVVGPNQ
jgi:hypothetical protein